MFSRRSAHDRSLNALAAQLATGGRPRYDLTSSNPTTAGIDYPEELLEVLTRAQAESLVYQPEPFGLPVARDAVARLVGLGAESRDVLLTASTSEAYAFLFKLLCDPGDAVLVPTPSYPLFEHLAELEGIEALPYRLAYDGAWHIDVDSLRRAITPRVKAVIVVSPNNPTGQYLADAEREALEALGLPVLSDEVFAPFPLLPRTAPGPRAEPACLWFTLDGLSKRAGLPQLKLGWTVLAGPAAARREARERLELIADTFLSVGTPIQQALPSLLEVCPVITGSILARCRENAAELQACLRDSPVSLLRAEAGWGACLRLPRVRSEEAWVLDLLTAEDVLVQPGWFYDFETEPHVVLSLLTEPSVFREGTARLARFVSRLAS